MITEFIRGMNAVLTVVNQIMTTAIIVVVLLILLRIILATDKDERMSEIIRRSRASASQPTDGLLLVKSSDN